MEGSTCTDAECWYPVRFAMAASDQYRHQQSHAAYRHSLVTLPKSRHCRARELWTVLRPYPITASSERITLGKQHDRPCTSAVPQLFVLSDGRRRSRISRGCQRFARDQQTKLHDNGSQYSESICAAGQPGS